jgi:hypothetical protein
MLPCRMSMRTRSLSLPLRSSVLVIVDRDLGVQPLQDIEEVNMFKDDSTVIHFKKPLSKILNLLTRANLELRL